MGCSPARQPGSRDDGVLLGDADIEDPIRKSSGKPVETRRMKHGGRDRHDVGSTLPDSNHGITECIGPSGLNSVAERLPGDLVDPSDGVELILLILLGGLEALAFAGDGVNQNGTLELSRLLEMPDDRTNVVTVYGSRVLQAEIGEHSLRCEDVLDPGFETVQQVVNGRPEPGSGEVGS